MKIQASFRLLPLFVGSIWIAVNIFFLPFFPWTEGLYRPWLLLHGFAPYKDFLWNRGIVDLAILGGVYKLFGVSPAVYQGVMFALFGLISLLLFLLLKKKSSTVALFTYSSYIIFLFPLFSNAEIEEVLVGLFSLISFLALWQSTEKKNLLPLWIAGMAAGVSYLTKQTSGVLIGISILFIIFLREKFSLVRWKKTVAPLGIYFVGVLIPLFIFVFYLVHRGIFWDYVSGLQFVATIYKGWAKPWGITGGMQMIGVYLSILVPFLFLASGKYIDKRIGYLLAAFIIGLFTMLLPSYWSYRLVASFPLLCIALAVVIQESLLLFQKNGNRVKKGIVIAGCIAFIGFFQSFGREYVQFIKDNGLSSGQYLLDYGDHELAAAAWLAQHTKKDEKIFNIANNIIMLKAERLPHNRYVGGMPIDFLPFDKTAIELASNPPRIVVLDRSILDSWPELKDWKFIDFLQKNYTLQQEFGSIAIYFL